MNKWKKLRLVAGLTQKQLADALGVSSAAIQGWEYGKANPRPSHWDKLGELYNIDREQIVSLCDTMSITGDDNVQTFVGRDQVATKQGSSNLDAQAKYFWNLFEKYGDGELLDKWISQLLLIKMQRD